VTTEELESSWAFILFGAINRIRIVIPLHPRYDSEEEKFHGNGMELRASNIID
jgi:hypothetical protein